MACSTLSLVAPLTGTIPFITFETVLGETPARRATSLTVARTAPLSKTDVNDVTARYHDWLAPASPALLRRPRTRIQTATTAATTPAGSAYQKLAGRAPGESAAGCAA